MITGWAKWRISRAIEEGKPLSPALARKVRRDIHCRRFYQASLEMAKRLRQDAQQIVRLEQQRLDEMEPSEMLQAGTTPSWPRPGRFRPALSMATAAAAAALAVAAAVWWWSSSRSIPDANPPVVAHQSDVTELVHIIRQIKDDVDGIAERKAPQWQQTMARSGAALRAPLVREAKNMAADTREILRAFSSMLPTDGRRQRPEPGDDAPPPSSSGHAVPASPAIASLAHAQPAAMIPL